MSKTLSIKIKHLDKNQSIYIVYGRDVTAIISNKIIQKNFNNLLYVEYNYATKDFT